MARILLVVLMGGLFGLCSANDACHYISVEGTRMNRELEGLYEVLLSTRCSGRQVYRNTDLNSPGFIFFFDPALEKVSPEMVAPPGLQGPPRGNSSFAEGWRKWYHSSASSSEESDDDDSSEERERNFMQGLLNVARDVVENPPVFLKQNRTQSAESGRTNNLQPRENKTDLLPRGKRHLTAPWKNQIIGWRLGPVSCYPYNAKVVSMDKEAASPTLVRSTWIEYVNQRWMPSQYVHIMCTDTPETHGSHWQFEGRQKLGFSIALFGIAICLLHTMWKHYKRRSNKYPALPRREDELDMEDDESLAEGPVRGHHYVVLNLAHEEEGLSPYPRGLLPREPEPPAEPVQPPEYEEVERLAEPESPPSYEEALRSTAATAGEGEGEGKPEGERS